MLEDSQLPYIQLDRDHQEVLKSLYSMNEQYIPTLFLSEMKNSNVQRADFFGNEN